MIDFKNLVKVQYNFDQNKLEQVLRQLDNKIVQVNNIQKQLLNRCDMLENISLINKQKTDKFQKFSIDNFRVMASNLTDLKESLKKELGQKWAQTQQRLQKQSTPIKSLLQTQISSFQSQTKQINKRMSILTTQVTKNSQQTIKKTQQLNKIIKRKQEQIAKVRISLKQSISQKFQECKKQLEDKNNLFLKQRISKIDQEMMKLAIIQLGIEQDKASLNQLISQSRNEISITSSKRLENQQIESDQQDNKIQSLKRKNTKTNTNRFNNINNKNNINKHIEQEPRHNRQKNKSIDFLISQLREQLQQLIKSQLLQFETSLKSLKQDKQKTQQSISSIQVNENKNSNSISQLILNLKDYKGQSDNIRNSLYDINFKFKELNTKMIQNSSNIAKTQNDLNQIKTIYDQKLIENQQKENTRFKQTQNIKKNGPENVNRASSIHRGAPSTPGRSSIKDESTLNKISVINQRLSYIQHKINGATNISSQCSLPKIQSLNNLNRKGSNLQSIQTYKKDIKQVNDQLLKTSQRLISLKKLIQSIESTYVHLPNKIEVLEHKITSLSELQEQRLLELIKQMINRALTDPFNNHFTFNLKKQIHVKFLEMKHQYMSIWKDIENKVTDRAEVAELEKLKEQVQNKDMEIKLLVGKKADNQDFKKAIKYLETKFKQIRDFVKAEEDDKPKKYYMGKK